MPGLVWTSAMDTHANAPMPPMPPLYPLPPVSFVVDPDEALLIVLCIAHAGRSVREEARRAAAQA